MEATKIKKDRLSEQAYNNYLEKEQTRLAQGYVMAQLPKGKNKVEKAQADFESGKLHKMFYTEAIENLEKDNVYMSGSRVSNISKASQDMQTRWADLKALVEATKFVGNDGKAYIGSCMIKLDK